MNQLVKILNEMSKMTIHSINGIRVEITSNYTSEENRKIAEKIAKNIHRLVNDKTLIDNITIHF